MNYFEFDYELDGDDGEPTLVLVGMTRLSDNRPNEIEYIQEYPNMNEIKWPFLDHYLIDEMENFGREEYESLLVEQKIDRMREG